MSRRLDDQNSETFWPGYVDAVTNLVLNLLFVVVIMTVAVFMFALELGRRQPSQSVEPIPLPAPSRPAAAGDDARAATGRDDELRRQHDALRQKEAELKALQTRIANLEREAGQAARQPLPARSPAAEPRPASPETAGTGATTTEPPRVVSATAPAPTPERGLERAVPGGTGGILVKFAEDAIALSRSEMDELRKALAPVTAAGGARVEVVVPAGFSEARRLGFYRVMAVRNQLIEMKIPADRIETAVRDGGAGADSSRVMVSPR